jgi:hypothetical protein
MKKLLCIASGIFTLGSASATPVVNWISWDSNSGYDYHQSGFKSDGNEYAYQYASGATGTLNLPNGSAVNVTLTGEVIDTSSFNTSSGDSSFWALFPNGTFTSANVPLLPSNSDYIAQSGYALPNHTLTFSAPVSNLVMNIWSLGGAEVSSYQFNQSFIILSQNNAGGVAQPFSVTGNTLSGQEASGTIQFTGTFTSLSWTVPAPEYYSGWNIGVTSASVPEPSTYALFGIGAIGMLMVMRRKKTA